LSARVGHEFAFFTGIQRLLSGLIRTSRLEASAVEKLCGLDVAYEGDEGVAAAVVWSRNGGFIERALYRGAVLFPYIPGLLYAREAPLMLAALRSLEAEPDLLIVDGHGLAHPRRAGLASIVGLLADKPSIGVAKGMLHGELRKESGREYLVVDGERVGVVASGSKGRRLYLSIGHRIDVESILELLELFGAALLEPLREADRVARQSARAGSWRRPRS